MQKICTCCGETKDISKFYKSNSVKNTYASKCKRCRNKQTYTWRLNNHERHLTNKRRWTTKDRQSFKRISAKESTKKIACDYLGGKCKMCGYDKHIAALEFHHRDPELKKYAISTKLREYDLEKLKPELEKCDLLCSNCHKILHWDSVIQGVKDFLNEKQLSILDLCNGD